jgi:hypothetical protein
MLALRKGPLNNKVRPYFIHRNSGIGTWNDPRLPASAEAGDIECGGGGGSQGRADQNYRQE